MRREVGEVMESKRKISNVALYLRKSRGDENSDLEKHRIVLRELCESKEWNYKEYAEIGTSDSIYMREAFSNLLREVEANAYDGVVVVDYDRLSRGDLYEQAIIRRVFSESQTLIITPAKTYDLSDESDELFADIKGMFARQEYNMIKKRMKQGKAVGAQQGYWTNGKPPYPYEYERWKEKYSPRSLVVNDDKLKHIGSL